MTWNPKKQIKCVRCDKKFWPTAAASKYCSIKCLILYNSKFVRSGCREWRLGTSKDGYGIHRLYTRTIRVHRELWAILKGPIPKGMCICHTCDNPACVNINHLFMGTRADNMQDMVTKNRHAKTGGVLNGRAILTEDNVREIRAAKKMNGMNIAFAKRFGVCVGTIEAVRSRRGWKEILDA